MNGDSSSWAQSSVNLTSSHDFSLLNAYFVRGWQHRLLTPLDCVVGHRQPLSAHLQHRLYGLTRTANWGYLGKDNDFPHHTEDAQVDGRPAAELVWHRGRQCEIGNCVEVAAIDEAVILRSSTSPGGVQLTLSREEWGDFLMAAKAGDFDGLASATGSPARS